MFELKSTEELCITILKIDANFDGKMTCGFINDMRNLVNFTGGLRNLKICTLTDFLSNVNNVELNNYRGNVRNLVNFHGNSRMSEIFVNSI